MEPHLDQQAEVTAEVKKTPDQIQINSSEKSVSTETIETPEQINWKKFREQREFERKAKEAADKRASDKEAEANALKAAMEALLNKQPYQSNNNAHHYEEEHEETEEQRIDKKVAAALQREREKIKEENKRHEQETFPQRLNETFPDFKRLCNIENLDYLDYHYPEITAAYKHMPDGYEKWASVYKVVKRFVPNTESHKEMKKMDNNLSKPQSASSTGLANASSGMPQIRLDEDKKAANWARMQKALKGIN
jgi:hypothetical protein